MQQRKIEASNIISNKTKKILILGATGLTGTFVLRLLLHSTYCHSILIWGRKAPPNLNSKCKFFSEIGNEFKYELTNTDAVICCLGTTIKKAGSKENFARVDLELPLQIAQIAKENQVPVFCLVSSVGADSNSSNFYLRTKGQLEKKLIVLNFSALHIMRPSLLLGPRTEFRLGESAAKMLMPILNPLLVKALSKYKAIKASDLARALAFKAIMHEQGETLSINHYMEIMGLSKRWELLHDNDRS